jgi:hypothetical protein
LVGQVQGVCQQVTKKSFLQRQREIPDLARDEPCATSTWTQMILSNDNVSCFFCLLSNDRALGPILLASSDEQEPQTLSARETTDRFQETVTKPLAWVGISATDAVLLWR